MKNNAKSVHPKPVPDPLLILVNNPKQHLHARNSFRNKIFWISKSPKFDDVIQSHFWAISKIKFANFCKTSHDIINCSTYISPFEKQQVPETSEQWLLFHLHLSGGVERKRKNTKIQISWESELFRWNKKHFS